MDHAIAILGRSLPVKRDFEPDGESVSFRYGTGSIRIPNRDWQYSGVVVHVKYQSTVDGVRVSVKIMPHILLIIIYILFFGAFVSFQIEPQDTSKFSWNGTSLR